MAERFELEIVTPERQLVREEVTEAQIPAKDGYLGILPGHAPLLSQLGTGFSLIPPPDSAGTWRCTAVSWKCCKTTFACWPISPSGPKNRRGAGPPRRPTRHRGNDQSQPRRRPRRRPGRPEARRNAYRCGRKEGLTAHPAASNPGSQTFKNRLVIRYLTYPSGTSKPPEPMDAVIFVEAPVVDQNQMPSSFPKAGKALGPRIFSMHYYALPQARSYCSQTRRISPGRR